MATAKITLIGFYQWMKANNDDLFANLSVPSGIDKNKLINTILMNGAEFEVLYGDADYFKFLIGPWSDKWYRTMDRWAKALAIDYAPLENYDRMEEWNDNGGSAKADGRRPGAGCLRRGHVRLQQSQDHQRSVWPRQGRPVSENRVQADLPRFCPQPGVPDRRGRVRRDPAEPGLSEPGRAGPPL